MLPGVVAAKRGQRKGQDRPGGRQRVALIVFVAIFGLLFIGFAIAQGIGAPSVPSGDVAIVQDVPDELGTISQEEFDHALEQQAATAKLKKTPEPGDEKYDELKEAALSELLNQIWLEGEAEELGVSVTDKQVSTELAKIKKESFPTPAAYNKFLKESHFTQEDVDDRVRLQLLSTKIQETVNAQAPVPTSGQIADYYEAEKATKYTTKESRDVRIVINEDKSKVDAAKKELEKDHSPGSWKKVAAKYSADPTTKSKGGLQAGISEEFLQGPLKSAIFDSATGELVGPVKFQTNYVVLEVVKLNPAKTKTLAETRSEISSTLTQEKQQEYFSEFVSSYQSKWTGRTYCASGFVTKQCANFQSSGHPESAPPACYEADPKTPAKECPAPVAQTQPALPGSVTVVKPKGEPFVQRPRPEAAATAEGAPGEVVPGAEEAAGGEGAAEAEPEPESSGE
ncbi:MAG TPA: SurA N-terminal domain-containing protein [Solirubrobacterales bacterium]|jgi:parvulin-like peptidyl-prolyl isomerase|nr:SurA N-terminal domain-containing protein [Solirubrobacterales bacterium]